MKYTITPWSEMLVDNPSRLHFDASCSYEAISMFVNAQLCLSSSNGPFCTGFNIWDGNDMASIHLPSWMVEFMPRVRDLPIFEWIKNNITVQQYEDAKSRARVRKLAALKIFSDAIALDLAKVAEDYPDLRDVAAEALAAAVDRTNRFGKFFTAHDGFAKLSEELDELKEHVNMREDSRDLEKMRSEAMDVVVVGIRFVAYACDEIVGRR